MILITGGTGYIGSHTATELLSHNLDVVICDNLSNSYEHVISQIEKITGKRPKFYNLSISDIDSLLKMFDKEKIDSVIHFAAIKSVPDSVKNPLDYYENNVNGTVTLLKAMKLQGIKKMIFSSSAAIYGEGSAPPFGENSALNALNPYSRTKIIAEEILRDICAADNSFSIISLRYFNPLGAHPTGLLGENPKTAPGNILPLIIQTAQGKSHALKITGGDFPTPDGTGVRDYIHIQDLAHGHYLALQHLAPGFRAYNLGGGGGTSVRELVRAFHMATGIDVPCQIAPRRPGDSAISVADISRAANELGFAPRYTVEDMCRDAWRYEMGERGGGETFS